MNPDKREKIVLNNPWLTSENAIWMASKISLRRNIDKFAFPAKLAEDRRRQLISLVSKKIGELEGLTSSLVYSADQLEPSDKEYIGEHFLTNETFQEAHGAEAFIVDSAGEFLATINIKDHLQLLLLDVSGRLDEKFSKMFAWERALQEAFTFAFSPQFGYVTSDFYEAGTGLSILAYLHIPLLIQTRAFASSLEKIQEEMVHVENFLGHAHPIGDMAVLTNRYCLGVNEEGIHHGVKNGAHRLEEEERRLREELKNKGSPEWKDRVSRAFAISTLSYQIESLEELLSEISLLKLGVDLGWIEGISISKLNHLFLSCRRAHLIQNLEGKVSSDELPHRRAEFIHQELQGAKLVI